MSKKAMAKAQQIAPAAAPVVAPASAQPPAAAGTIDVTTPEAAPVAPKPEGHHFIRRHYVNGELVS